MQGRSRVIQTLLLGLAIVAGGVGFALADDTSGGTAGTPAGTAGGGGVASTAQLTLGQMVASAAQIRANGVAVAQSIMAALDDARREENVRKINCLDDKFTQANAALRMLETRRESLRNAARAGDTTSAQHEYSLITVIGQNFSTLALQARTCVGTEIFETGATQVTTTVGDGTPEEDLEITPDPPEVEVPFIPIDMSLVRMDDSTS